MLQPLTDFLEFFKVLSAHEVDFIVVGGVSAVLQGAPINTLDLDIVHSRAAGNLDRLEAALRSIDAHYRIHPKKIAPTASLLASPGHNLLTTTIGPLDVLGTIGDDLGYNDLLPFAVPVTLEMDMVVQVLGLEKLIEMKVAAGRSKDHAVLPTLRATLKERQQDAAREQPPEPPPS